MRLFLASESPRRRELLKTLVKEFTVEAPCVEEISSSAELSPEELVLANAALKADAVCCRHPEDWVLAADTVVELDNKVYGKPRDLAEAAEVLQVFSGRTHRVITAVVLECRNKNKKSEFAAVSTVKFRNLSKHDIACYLSQVPVLDKAGSYGIQDKGEMLVESIEGELENIIGLPVKALANAMIDLGILN
ncbi:MAG: septum formation protein Maf [Lentisphaeria bacterium]|nr:septum formation protein Maf [Lentisphaerota bacterium]MBR7144979.1 septum formation protein Maf [Lentisphaeria bacterium]